MRVVAGSARGRLLRTPAGRGTRPTSDRVREAVFSALVSLGALDGATVVDLFAGSGALGIEALSRGAAAATFVEHDGAAAAVIQGNLSTLGLDGPAVQVTTTDAMAVAVAAAGADIVFADPPYRFDRWPELLGALAAGGFAGLLVAESGRPLDLPDGWEVVRERAYGSTVVTVLRPVRTQFPGGVPR